MLYTPSKRYLASFLEKPITLQSFIISSPPTHPLATLMDVLKSKDQEPQSNLTVAETLVSQLDFSTDVLDRPKVLNPSTAKRTEPALPQNPTNPITYIRAIGALAVVLIHCSGELLYQFDTQDHFSAGYITGVGFYSFLRWATPFFILISGALLLDMRKKEEPRFDFIKKRAKKVLVPFAFWGVIYLLYENRSDILTGQPISIQKNIDLILFKDIYYHLWFVPMIVGLYLLTPFFKTFLKAAKKSDIEYFLALCFIFTGLQNFWPNLFIVKYIGWFGYAGYYMLGHYLTTYPIRGERRKWLYIAGIASIPFHAVATLIASHWQNAYVSTFFIYFSPNVVLLTAALFTFLWHFDWEKFNLKKPRLNKFLLHVNQLSFGIYFSHVLVLDVIKNGYLYIQASPKYFMYNSVPAYVGVPIFAVIVVSLTILLVMGLRNTRARTVMM